MIMDIKIIQEKLTRQELSAMAQRGFGDFVKAVVDLEQEIMAVGGELHADEEALLLERGSKQENLWGVNLYPAIFDASWIEFDSMINIRPRQGNRSRAVEDAATRQKIIEIVSKWVEK